MQTKIPSKVEKAATVFDKFYRGCGWLLINLFVMGFLCWGLYGSFVGFRVETNGEVTEGSVVGLDHFDGGTYSAIVEFEVNGQAYSFEDDTASSPPKYEIGETVPVRYDQSNPNLAQIDSKVPLWLFPSCSVLVLILALIGVNIWGWRAWKRGEEMVDLL
ncbi:MAG: DUF3592 domain-containing protein [Chloroflexi bacterium]|nr:DUF3592 domain-containing protein [Chloroflexota bacterium]